jgi:Glycosyltransferase family 87
VIHVDPVDRAPVHPASHRRAPGAALIASSIGLFWIIEYLFLAEHGRRGVDSHAYWLTRNGIHYGILGDRDAYLYSPAFAQVIRPLTLLPWPAFEALWAIAAAAIYLWLIRDVEWRWWLPLLALAIADLVIGNLWALFALVCVIGIRRPALWAIPALTKLSPVGFIWFGVRRDWRSLGILAAATAAVVAVSAAIDPGAWSAWMHMLTHSGGDPLGLGIIAAGIGVAVFAAATDRAWLLPVAMLLTTPILGVIALAVLLAIPRLTSGTERGRDPGSPLRG